LVFEREAVATEAAAVAATVAAPAVAAVAAAAATAAAAAVGGLRRARARSNLRLGRLLELGLPVDNGRTVAEDAVDGTGPRVFERNEWVRVLSATVSGLLPRLATGCGKATDVDFDLATRTYSVKSLAMNARGQAMAPGSAVVCTRWDGTEEMYCRGSAAARRRGRSTRSRERTGS
jgi:hypothetical protein